MIIKRIEQIHIHYGENERQVWTYKPENRIVDSRARLSQDADRWLDWREILELAKTDENLNRLVEQAELYYRLKK